MIVFSIISIMALHVWAEGTFPNISFLGWAGMAILVILDTGAVYSKITPKD